MYVYQIKKHSRFRFLGPKMLTSFYLCNRLSYDLFGDLIGITYIYIYICREREVMMTVIYSQAHSMGHFAA